MSEQSTSHTLWCPQAGESWAPRMGQCQGHCSSLLLLQTAPGTLTQHLSWGHSSAPLRSFPWRHSSSSWGWSSTCSFPKNVRQGEGMLVLPPCTGGGPWAAPPALPRCDLSLMALDTPCQHTKDLKLQGRMVGVQLPQAEQTFPGCSSSAWRGFASASLCCDSLLCSPANQSTDSAKWFANKCSQVGW